jgi:quercetin 2,3-dioxygenase
MVTRILHSFKGQPHQLGPFQVKTYYPEQGKPLPDPFLLFDHFGPFYLDQAPESGLASHPHFGAEIGTYMISGRVSHRDSLGHEGTVTGGGLQWMTVGSGLIHAEKPGPQEGGGMVEGIQFWVNLPAAHKHDKPIYRAYQPEEFPIVTGDGYKVKVVAGSLGDATSPLVTVTPFRFLHVWLEAGKTFVLPNTLGDTLNVYAKTGTATANHVTLSEHTLYRLQTDQTEVRIEAGATAIEVIILTGQPLREPVVFQGPFVLSSAEQYREVIQSYHSGGMGNPEFQ